MGTKFTLLYGHHQPTTFKIVSPAKLGLDSSNKQEGSSMNKIEPDMQSKRITTTNKFLASPVFRSLPDFSLKKSNNNNLTPPKSRLKSMMPSEPMNVNGKGLGD